MFQFINHKKFWSLFSKEKKEDFDLTLRDEIWILENLP